MFRSWNVLTIRRFLGLGRFEFGTFCSWYVLRLGSFCSWWDVLKLGHLVAGTYAMKISYLGRFEVWTFCLGAFCRCILLKAVTIFCIL
jgi:hypothetical protein